MSTHTCTIPGPRFRATVVFFLVWAAASLHADPLRGLSVVHPDGSIKIEAEAMETWNGCMERFNEMCGQFCDPFGTVDPKGRNCWNQEDNGMCSGLMGVGLCGTFSFVDFMPVPKASSFSIRHAKVTENFTFSIFVNGEPWRTNITFPPSSYKIMTDSGEVRIKEWRDTLFQDVPLDRDTNFIRVQRTGTGIPTIDYITVYPDGVGASRAPHAVMPEMPILEIRGNVVHYSVEGGRRVTVELIDASGRIARRLVRDARKPGTCTLPHDGRGVFFVRLRAGNTRTRTTRFIALD